MSVAWTISATMNGLLSLLPLAVRLPRQAPPQVRGDPYGSAPSHDSGEKGLHGSINRISWPTLYSNNASEKSQHCHPHRPPKPHPADLHYRNPLPPLLNYRTVLSCVTSEVRSVFTSPVPLGLIRLVPTGGHTINGDFFLEGVSQAQFQVVFLFSVSRPIQTRAYHRVPHAMGRQRLPAELHRPHGLPPRALAQVTLVPILNTFDSRSLWRDQRHTTQPFLQGQRDGYAQNLARMEIVLNLGNLLDYFDLKAEGRLGRWEDQKTYAVWVKTPLPVRLRVREGVNRSLLGILSYF
ncbi:hypothetical protein BDV34DRAFT_219472 [Aspergillus parasiticus]|uniref:Uncharacterized protein n=1 Tax=Aspergillus parasiticus TaxID=5067 RepID=A0A5N6E2T5_ASPPA|nr:hypothetical protein BDV34DRAFT_219472 [Aspergillus parasiticus]